MPPAPPPPVLADAHCHLQDSRIAPRADAVLARARDAGIAAVHVNATSELDAPAVLALRARHPGFVAVSLGVHPWRLDTLRPGWLRRLRAALLRERAGIGEIGLDARVGDGRDALRRDVFRAQLDLSYELALPASLHCRGAWGEMLDILLRAPPHPAGLLVHAYSGPPDALPALAARNVCVSFGGSSTRPANKRAAAAIRAAVPGRFLIETDAPDLPPELPPGTAPRLLDPATGRLLSEPAYLPLVVRRIADLRQTAPSAVAAATTAAFRRLFAPILPA
ncbi:MAG: TatD family hydrolase [Kiritimatiellae bacterium]|nr:TatD family hydrolase [Kiritimatiellia bacterium]